MQEATTGSNADEGLNAKVQQLFNHDGCGRRAHASCLHAHWDAVHRAGVAEQAAMIIDELRLLKATIKARRDPLGAVRVAWEEDDWGVVP